MRYSINFLIALHALLLFAGTPDRHWENYSGNPRLSEAPKSGHRAIYEYTA